MTRHPEQARALSYLRRRGTDADPHELRERVARTLGRLERRLDEVDSETARRRPDESTWSVQEVVNHLTVSLEPGVGQLEALVEGCSPGKAVAAGLLDNDALSVPWPAALARLRAVQAAFLEVLDRAIESEAALDRTVPAVMVVKVDDESGKAVPLEWIEELDWKSFAVIPHVHTFEHLDQIRRTLSRVSGT